MEILKKIDDLLIGWGISPSRADMLDQFIAFALILAVAFLADAPMPENPAEGSGTTGEEDQGYVGRHRIRP